MHFNFTYFFKKIGIDEGKTKNYNNDRRTFFIAKTNQGEYLQNRAFERKFIMGIKKNKFGATIIDDPEVYKQLSKKYNIGLSEIIQIDLNRCGIYLREGEIRENFRVRFKGKILGDYESWFALPVMSAEDTNFNVHNGYIYFKDKLIGKVNGELMLDTCENSYQRGPNLLNLNSRSRSNCGGCKACIHNYHDFYDKTVIKDKQSLLTKEDLEHFFDSKNIDVSKLAQIAVVTGLFGSEQNVVNHMKLVSEVAKARGFRGELMYFGCEVNSELALDELAKLGNFSLIYALDNFSKRDMLLARKKSLITLDFAKQTLETAKSKGIKTTISYIDGIDPLADLKEGFNFLAKSLTNFPIVNVYQIQTMDQANILEKEATDLSYYLESRIAMEQIFKSTDKRPKRWSNYRPLWYKEFADEQLPNNSYGQLEKQND